MTVITVSWRNSVWPYIAIAILLVGLAVSLTLLYRARKLLSIPILPPAPDPRVAEQSQTIADLRNQISELKTEHGKQLDGLIAQAEIELANRTRLMEEKLRAEFAESKRTDRQRSNLLSRGALLAKVAEHMGPLIPGFPYPLKECRHIGEVFDYLVFDGLESDPSQMSVVFLEVKTSTTGRQRRVTNPRERALRQAIKAGRVRYEVWQPPTAAQLETVAREAIAAAASDDIDKLPAD
jgi:predicted Holliday junction resolvase-like endonuclease